MALTSLVTSLRIGTFLTSGNPRLSMAVLNVHAQPPTVSRVSMAVVNIMASPPTVSRVSQVEIDAWVSLDQAFYAQGLFGGPEVFAPDFFVEPIFESPAAPEIEVNPYRAAEPNTDLQQILREQHNVTQAGDSTFHWGVLTDIYNEPLYNLGSLGKFYHDDLGIIHARYCRFVDFNLTDAKASPVGLRKPGNLPWTVTNQLSLSHADAVIGIALPYDNKVNIGTWYGWVVTKGFLPAEVPVTISNKSFPFGTEYGWSANGNIAQELDSVSVGYRVRIDNDPRMQPGAFYVHTDRSSLGRANGLITTRLAPLVSDIEGLDTRLTPLEATVAGHTIAIAAVNKKHDDFVLFMTKEVKNLSDALMAIRALMPDGNFKTYVDTSVAALKGYVDTAITVVGNVANAGLARANEAMQFAQSISYAGIQTQIDALNNAMGGITNRIIGFKTTIDTGLLDEGQVLVSYLYDTDVDGVKYFDFRPVDFVLESLLNVDMVTTLPVHGDSLVYDGVNSKWVPFAVSGGGGGIPEAPTDSTTYGRNNAAWVPVGGGGDFELIEVLTPSAAASISSEAWAAGGYKRLVFNIRLTMSNDGVGLTMRYKLSGAYKTAANHRFYVRLDSSSASTSAESSQTGTGAGISGTGATWGVGNAALEHYASDVMVFSPDDTTKPKTYRVSATYGAPSGAYVAAVGGGAYDGADAALALEGIQFLVSAGTFTGEIDVYGLK